MTQYNHPEDVIDLINDLRKRVDQLERAPRLQNATIDKGSLQVKDDTGDVRIRLGQLDDGSYGLAEYDTNGAPLSLTQVMFGLAAKSNDAEIDPALNAWVDDPALSTTVTVTNGRMIVIVSAKIVAGNSGSGTPSSAWYGYRASGPTTLGADFGKAVMVNYTTGQNAMLQASWVDVRLGIANGDYTVTPTMYASSTGSPANGAAFSYRRVTILPF